jgi:hypothetical protein
MAVSQNLLHPRKLGHKNEIFWIEDSLDTINHFNCLFQNRFKCKRCKILLDFFPGSKEKGGDNLRSKNESSDQKKEDWTTGTAQCHRQKLERPKTITYKVYFK